MDVYIGNFNWNMLEVVLSSDQQWGKLKKKTHFIAAIYKSIFLFDRHEENVKRDNFKYIDSFFFMSNGYGTNKMRWKYFTCISHVSAFNFSNGLSNVILNVISEGFCFLHNFFASNDKENFHFSFCECLRIWNALQIIEW